LPIADWRLPNWECTAGRVPTGPNRDLAIGNRK